jgi:hypothetical protein
VQRVVGGLKSHDVVSHGPGWSQRGIHSRLHAVPIPDDFYEESMYRPEAWYIHDLLEVDQEAGRVVGQLDTTRIDVLVEPQREWPGHDKHLPGAVAIQMTATMAQFHAFYILGLRATEGWVGYGTHIRNARFPTVGKIGPPVTAEATALRVRQIRGTYFVDYAFRYTQEDRVIYESEQTAAYIRSDHRGPLGDR